MVATGRLMNGEEPFDYICWDLYARTSQHYKDHPETLAWRAETLQGIEHVSGIKVVR